MVMNLETHFFNQECYFEFFKEKCEQLNLAHREIYKEIQHICKKIQVEIEKVTPENFFQILAKVLGLDAQLQIMLELVELDNTDLSDREIINYAKKDYKTYMYDLCNPKRDTKINSLHFLVL